MVGYINQRVYYPNPYGPNGMGLIAIALILYNEIKNQYVTKQVAL